MVPRQLRLRLRVGARQGRAPARLLGPPRLPCRQRARDRGREFLGRGLRARAQPGLPRAQGVVALPRARDPEARRVHPPQRRARPRSRGGHRRGGRARAPRAGGAPDRRLPLRPAGRRLIRPRAVRRRRPRRAQRRHRDRAAGERHRRALHDAHPRPARDPSQHHQPPHGVRGPRAPRERGEAHRRRAGGQGDGGAVTRVAQGGAKDNSRRGGELSGGWVARCALRGHSVPAEGPLHPEGLSRTCSHA
mmetsp:Transcript_11778/g.35543  ORF Transcript_11778/g.35543 Transcript_11778/m.35543 type:complete len:248 (+) Transcript_11778:1034-1777(+)